MITAVVLISISKLLISPENNIEEKVVDEEDIQTTYLVLAVIFGLVGGLTFFINSVEMFYSISHTTVSPLQASIGGVLLLSLYVLPFLIY